MYLFPLIHVDPVVLKEPDQIFRQMICSGNLNDQQIRGY